MVYKNLFHCEEAIFLYADIDGIFSNGYFSSTNNVMCAEDSLLNLSSHVDSIFYCAIVPVVVDEINYMVCRYFESGGFENFFKCVAQEKLESLFTNLVEYNTFNGKDIKMSCTRHGELYAGIRKGICNMSFLWRRLDILLFVCLF